jgi:hypothetical protein
MAVRVRVIGDDRSAIWYTGEREAMILGYGHFLDHSEVYEEGKDQRILDYALRTLDLPGPCSYRFVTFIPATDRPWTRISFMVVLQPPGTSIAKALVSRDKNQFLLDLPEYKPDSIALPPPPTEIRPLPILGIQTIWERLIRE